MDPSAAADGADFRATLRSAYFFHELSDHDLTRLEAACHAQRWAEGDVIFEEGDAADRFYIVTGGSVEVWKDHGSPDRDLLAVHGEGNLFGEMALVDDLPRSATVVAREPTDALYIGRDDFHAILSENSSIALSIMANISSMVRSSNETFTDSLRERNRELERANEELRAAQEELLRAERLSTLGKFASLVLHDIRNPLSILRGYAEMIVHHNDAAADPQVDRNAQRIIHEADRLNDLASELLDFSRGEVRLNVSPVNLGTLVARVAEAIADRFRARKIDVVQDVEFAGPVLADEARLYRVYLNLADNARKAMTRGGTFTMRVSLVDEALQLGFADTGVGMSEEALRRVFEPFVSFSEEGGSGLGMAIVKNIVDAHRGAMTLTSSEAAGTSITITIPSLI
jgi:signal transduction histidine kinase